MRKNEILTNLVVFLPLVVVLVVTCATFWPYNVVLIVFFYSMGLANLIYAKLPQIYGGAYFSFGPSPVTETRRWAYYSGYKLIEGDYVGVKLGIRDSVLRIRVCQRAEQAAN